MQRFGIERPSIQDQRPASTLANPLVRSTSLDTLKVVASATNEPGTMSFLAVKICFDKLAIHATCILKCYEAV